MPQHLSTSHGLRVFLLEDHEDTRNLLHKHLENLGHTVRSAASTREATAEIRKADLDVLLCDIGLTDGLGWSFLESLHFTKPIFAIAMSGANAPEDIARSRQAGFRHHLVKPLDFALLNQLLKDAAAEVPSRNTRKALNE